MDVAPEAPNILGVVDGAEEGAAAGLAPNEKPCVAVAEEGWEGGCEVVAPKRLLPLPPADDAGGGPAGVVDASPNESFGPAGVFAPSAAPVPVLAPKIDGPPAVPAPPNGFAVGCDVGVPAADPPNIPPPAFVGAVVGVACGFPKPNDVVPPAPAVEPNKPEPVPPEVVMPNIDGLAWSPAAAGALGNKLGEDVAEEAAPPPNRLPDGLPAPPKTDPG